jgi:hypothetical protein
MSRSGGFTKSDTSLENILSPEQNQVLRALVAQVLPQIGQAGEVYQGQIAPGASPLQQQGFDMLGGMFGGQSGNALANMLSGQSAYQVDPAARDKLYGAEKASQMSQLQDTFKMIEERANMSGAGRSGGLQHSLGQAAAQTQLGLGQFYGGLSYKDEQERRMGLENAAQRQLGGLGAQQGMLQMLLGGGQTQRNIMGQQNAEGYNKWLAAQPYANPMVSAYLPTILGTQTQTPVQESTSFSF